MRVALPTRFREVLGGLPHDLEVAWYRDGASCRAVVPDAEVLWLDLQVQAEVKAALAVADQLQWLSSHRAGVDAIPLDLLRDRGVRVTNAAGLLAGPIAEYAVMAILAAAKGFPQLVRAQDRAMWLPAPPSFGELDGTQALIVGYGRIGRAIAERLRAFAVKVTGVRRRPDGELGVIGPMQWRSRLAEFDWVILAAALTAETHHLLGTRELAAMKADAWVCNVARGSLVDQQALVVALRSRAIGGAYLDVTNPEPLPADSEMWHLPNLILTPHTSGASRKFPQQAADLFLDNLARYRSGGRLRNLVDLDAGY